MTITIAVAGRIATATATTQVVAGNTYPVALSLDSEWTGSLYLRVRFGGLYYDIPFASSATSVDVQMPVGYPEVGIGVFSEALEICTNEARVRLLRSILEAGEQVVEFDSDLYDQWAGEVTTLLTDDAFDAESTRPVQNAVITAWKNTVPLDADLVHKTGNESIAGNKTFQGTPAVQSVTPSVNMTSSQAHNATTNKAILAVYDQKDGANSSQSQIIAKTASSYEQVAFRVSKPARDGSFEMVNRVFNDRQEVLVTGLYYPTDGSGNPQALASNVLMASGQIAVDPRLVHTSGVETIAGAKTFTSLLTASNVQVKDASTPTVTMLKGSTEVANLASDGTQAGITASSQFFGLRGLGTAPFGQSPSYTADNSADGKIVTRSMLATTPTVVHTTGSETVAGNKEFTGRTTVNDLRWGYGTAIVNAGACCRFYEVSPAQYGTGAEIRVYNDYDLNNSIGSCFVYSVGNAPAYNLNGRKEVMPGYKVMLAKRASDGVVEVWLKNIGSSAKAVVCEVRHIRGVPPTVAVQSGSEPEVGDTYSAVYEVTA